MSTESPSRHFLYRLKRLYLLANQCLDESLREHGIGRGQWQVLKRVHREGSITQRALQAEMSIEAATLTGIVDVLVGKGWLERQPDTSDKRVRVLRLTPLGEDRWHSIPDVLAQIEERMSDEIDPKDMQLIEDGVERMIHNLEEHRKGTNEPDRKST